MWVHDLAISRIADSGSDHACRAALAGLQAVKEELFEDLVPARSTQGRQGTGDTGSGPERGRKDACAGREGLREVLAGKWAGAHLEIYSPRAIRVLQHVEHFLLVHLPVKRLDQILFCDEAISIGIEGVEGRKDRRVTVLLRRQRRGKELGVVDLATPVNVHVHEHLLDALTRHLGVQRHGVLELLHGDRAAVVDVNLDEDVAKLSCQDADTQQKRLRVSLGTQAGAHGEARGT
jgi:hypothetical protein